MSQQLREENLGTLATISAGLSFPYIWGAMLLLLSWLYRSGFFGADLGGSLVAALLCLGLANPIVPGVISSMAIRPLFRNILGREIVPAPGCIAGLIVFAVTALSVLFFLARNFTVAAILFAVAPIAGLIVTALVTLVARGGLPSLPTRRGSRPPRVQVSVPRRELPDSTGRLPLRQPRRREPSRLPPPRRTEQGEHPTRPPPPPRR